MDATSNARAWNGIARLYDEPTGPLSAPHRMVWTARAGAGPGEEILGRLYDTVVAELGCGTGEHAALVASRGARTVYGVDVAEHRILHARVRFGHLPGICWRVGDAAEVLDNLPTLDICYSVFGALWYADPDRLLPAVHGRLRCGGLLAFSANTPRLGETSGQRVDNVTVDGIRLPVVYYAYTAEEWRRILLGHGFCGITVREAPVGDYRTLIVTAHRPGPCSMSARAPSQRGHRPDVPWPARAAMRAGPPPP